MADTSEERRPADSTTADGDASSHLEELLAEVAPAVQEAEAEGDTLRIELVGPHLRLSGDVNLGRFRRLSDFLNSQTGLIVVSNAVVLRRNGDPTKVTARRIWVSPAEVTIIGQPDSETAEAPPSFRIVKAAEPMIFVTPGHTMTGEVYIPSGGDLAVFIESADPPFIPLTDARTRSLADRRIIMRYGFAMLNRRHIVAATELQAGMAPGRSVL